MTNSLREVLHQHYKKGTALGAFNAANLETIRAIVEAAESTNTPAMIEVSPGEVDFIGLKVVTSVVWAWKNKANQPLFLNLDHAYDPEVIKQAVDSGFDLVHFDGSAQSFEENVKATREVAEYAHRKGVLVEGEIERIEEKSEIHRGKLPSLEGKMTDPQQAAKFVRETGVDLLAVSVGNIHGVYKEPPRLDFERLSKIQGAVGSWLSFHGGSGVKDEDLVKAIKLGGIVKVNINTELRMAFFETLREVLQENTQEIVPYKVYPQVIDAVRKVVEGKIKVLERAN